MPEENDNYALLKVPRYASTAEIKKAVRKQALRYHPDKHVLASPEVQEAMAKRFKHFAHAYEVLSDDAQRAQYDRSGASKYEFEDGGSTSDSGTRSGGDKSEFEDGVGRAFVYDDIEKVFHDLTSHIMSALGRDFGKKAPSAGTLALSGAVGAFCGFLLGSTLSSSSSTSSTSTIPVLFYTTAGAVLGAAAPIVYPAVQEATLKVEGPQRALLLDLLLQVLIAHSGDKEKN